MKLKQLSYLMLCFFLSMISTNHIESQSSPSPYEPKVIPPSPNAASLGKFGDVPVSGYTGTTDVSVPFYTVQANGITVPITLSYHTGGIRLAEESGWVGLGWALSAGGMITRNIMDKDDFDGSKYFTTSLPNPQGAFLDHSSTTCYSCGNLGYYGYAFACNYNVYTDHGTYDYTNAFVTGTSGSYDLEPDIYSFNFLGKSGKFIITRSGTIVLQSQDNIKISYQSNGNSFNITDDQGNKYYFYDLEMNQPATGTGGPYVSSWLLSKVVSQQKDSIIFNYTTDNTWTTVKGTIHETHRSGCAGNEQPVVDNDAGQSYINRYLQNIDFANGQVQFSFDGNRSDLKGGKKLNAVKIYSKINGNLNYLKENDLYYSYFNPYSSGDTLEYLRLRLDSVKEVSGASSIPPYSFIYNMPSNYLSLMAKHSYSVDHWGFYNAAGNTTFVPSWAGMFDPPGFGYPPYYISFTEANREVDTTAVKAFSLHQVVYPTGGFTLFDYDPNYYDHAASSTGPRDMEQYALHDTAVQVQATSIGTTTGSINLSSLVSVSQSTSNATLSLAFRGNVDSLNKYHTQTSQKITFTFNGGTTDISSSGVTCNGSGVCSITVPLTITTLTSYTWSAYIDPIIGSGFTSIVATVSWQMILADQRSMLTAGGLRLKAISDYNTNGTVAKTRKYDYTSGSSSTGRLMSFPSYARWEIFETPSITCIGLTRYGSSSSSLTSIIQGNIVGYDQVTETTNDFVSGNDNGKIVYNYYNSADSTVSYNGYRLPGVFNIGYSLDGQLKSKTIYKNNGDGSYSKVFESDNYFHTTNRSIYYSPKSQILKAIVVNYNTNGCSGYNEPYSVLATFYPSIKSEKTLLDSTKEFQYDQISSSRFVLNQSTNYYDNPVHYQLTRSISKDSKGNSHISFIRYPQDFLSGSSTGNIVLDSMVTKNMITPAIEKRDSFYYNGSGSGYISGAQASTFKLASGIVVPDKQYLLKLTAPITDYQVMGVSSGSLTMDGRLRQMASTDSYDANNNITQYTTTNGIPVSIIWDYISKYPVAKIIKGLSGQSAYTSFEADGTGGWAGIGSYVVIGMPTVTGKNYYNQNSFSISKSGLQTANYYTVSYWSKNGAYAVNGTISGWPVQLRTIVVNGQTWNYYEHKITGDTTAIVSGSGAIDELRLYPFGAQMTTFTYDPLLGITTQCDINNRITYYNYDGFQRLVLILDDNKNVLKKICYSYQGQPASCSFYMNTIQSAVFTRNNCGTGYIGGQATYSVAANSYYSTLSQSDADSKAQADVNNNGQAYANANGSCTAYVCSSSNCSGDNHKCISNVCETGVRANMSTVHVHVLDPNTGLYVWKWKCTWKYCFSDGTTGAISYDEYNDTACTLNYCGM